MFLETKTNIEYHANGQLKYMETVAILAPLYAHLYESRRVHPNGHQWVRIGRQVKYFDNGQLAWELNYDDNGNLIKNDYKQYREDGSVII